MDNLDFSKREIRAEFIKNTESGLYSGTNVDGEEVIVMLEKGKGMDVYTIHKEKPRWYEVIDYDETGERLSVRYEPV